MSTPPLEIRLLGAFGVRCGDHEVDPSAYGGALARRLLRVLAVHQGSVVSRDALEAALWPRDPPADPDANLAVQVSRLRRAVGATAIRTVGTGYALAGPDACQVDATHLIELVARGRSAAASGHQAAARAAFGQALRIPSGDPLPEDDGDWAEALRARVATARLEALVGAAALAPDPAEAVDLAREAVATAPLHEPSHLLLVQALAAGGDRPGALAAWERMRRVLREELGLDPSARAAALQAAVLRDAVAPVVRRQGPAHRLLPFVGRQRERDALRDLLAGPPTGVGVVLGVAGAGKSRLLQEVCTGTDPLITVRAFPAERAEPGSLVRRAVAQALARTPQRVDGLGDAARAALAGLHPADAAPEPGGPLPLDARARRALQREAWARVLEAVPGTVVVVDDLQWADATSIEALTHLLDRRRVGAVLLAARLEEVGAVGGAAELIAHLDLAHSPRRVVLGALDDDALRQLAPDPALRDLLTHHTDRTPFAIAEVVADLRRRGLVAADDDAALRLVDPEAAVAVVHSGQVAAVATRARRRPPPERRLLCALALLGRAAPTNLLADAAGLADAAALAAAGGLDRAGLIRHGDGGWTTAHDLVGEAVAADLDAAERVRWHAELAAALGSAGADPAEVAGHLERAGDPAAAHALAAAAEAHLARHAGAEAAGLADRALVVVPAGDDALRARALEVRAEARRRLGQLSGAREDLRAALALRIDPAARSRLLAALAVSASGAQDMAHAEELAELALVAAGDRPVERARALSVASVLDFNTGRPDRAARRAEEALALYRVLGDTRGVADILDGRAMATFLDGHVTDAVGAFDRVAMLFADAGDLHRVLTPRSTRGHALVFAGRAAQGLQDIDDALDLAGQLGSPEARTYALWHRAEALAALERPEEAADAAAEALAVARAIDHRGWTATAHRAVGIAHEAAGDLEAAAVAYATSREAAIPGLRLFIAWACARLAGVLVRAGHPGRATPLVAEALVTGPPLAGFEARLAEVELAAARGDPRTPALAGAALAAAVAQGWAADAGRLAQLAGVPAGSPAGTAR